MQKPKKKKPVLIYIQVILGLRVDHTMRVFVLYRKKQTTREF